jgi:hypothetical protein
MPFETVYEVWDYWDGIRSGFADYHGVPHYFAAEWDEADDDYLNTFTLRRVDASTIALVQEHDRIFEDWQWAAHRAEVPQQSHPAISGQNPRFADLTATIQARTESAPIVATGVIGTFKADEGEPEKPLGMWRKVRVQWSSRDETVR